MENPHDNLDRLLLIFGPGFFNFRFTFLGPGHTSGHSLLNKT